MKKIIITILLVVLCLGIVGGGIAGIVKLTDTGKLDMKTLSSTKFSVGGLDSNGKYMNTNASIYTKEAFECQGLEVSLDFDNEIEYQIYFYDQNNDFVHTTGKLSGAFVKDSVPFFAKYARIVVTPKNDEVVSKLEVAKYAGQLTVKVNREQGYKNYTENLFEVAAENKKISSDGSIVVDETNLQCVSNYINLSSYDEAMLIRVPGNMNSITLHFYDNEKNHLGSAFTSDVCDMFVSSEGVNYYSLDIDSLAYGSNVSFMAFYMTKVSAEEFAVYCR